jgi:7-keto-8-aminopelargonate synthetase-like enzyme
VSGPLLVRTSSDNSGWLERTNSYIFAPDTVDAAHRALDTHGLGSDGSRWIAGTTHLHTWAEELIAQRLGQPAALTYPDSYIDLSSTIAALCRTTDGYTSHRLFIPARPVPAIEDGLLAAPKKNHPTVLRYNDLASLVQRIREQKPSCYIAVVLSAHDMNLHTAYQDLQRCIGARRSSKTTVLIHDEPGMSSFVSNLAPQHTQWARLLIHGSFVTAFDLPGSYLAGDAALIKEVRYSSRAYMFTTSQFPFVMGMIVAKLVKTEDREGISIIPTKFCVDLESKTPEVLVIEQEL